MGDDNGNVRGRGGYKDGEKGQRILSEAQLREASEISGTEYMEFMGGDIIVDFKQSTL